MAASWKKNYSNYRSFIVSNFSRYRQRSDVKAYLELFLSLASIIIFCVFALRPTLLAIARLYKEIETNNKTIQTMDTKIANLRKIQTLIDQESTNIGLLNQALPDEPLPDEFTRQLEGISEQSKTQVTAMSLSEMGLLISDKNTKRKKGANLPAGLASFSFSISAIANYPELFNLLTELEGIRRVAVVNTVNIQPRSTNIGNFINISISGNTPFVPDAASIAFPANTKQ